MPRPCKNRHINGYPVSVLYKPAGIPAASLQWIQLNLDEFESIRLIDQMGLEQEQAAEQMGVSRPTVTRIYASARKKIADALVLGQALRIEGGPIIAGPCGQTGFGPGRGMGCRKRHQHGHGHNSNMEP
jgi:predicted DNA-binding protein (UPF0251 family)